MTIAAGMIALSESFRDMTSGTQVVDALESLFQSFGATHFLATGIPLPGRPIDPLVVRLNWADSKGTFALKSDDPVLNRVLGTKRPFIWLEPGHPGTPNDSALLAALGEGPARFIALPICAFQPYQAVVLAGGANMILDTRPLLILDYVVIEAFRRMLGLGFIRAERPGDLSARERRVVELSASGKTANEIADILEISQRTVHAHLQNASEKLAAHNKTHTVVEALRYGQISV
ncbi:MAG TPA: helix-turn-helix transcriptional regulator [Bauldia sp.]|nr:helix-turn-helix transcriptional regulator [Bauldia sp.]